MQHAKAGSFLRGWLRQIFLEKKMLGNKKIKKKSVRRFKNLKNVLHFNIAG
jgi:hypothetical protein